MTAPAPELLTRAASFAPATFNAEARTVELVWTTGARVERRDFWTGKRYYEELSLDDGAVDLSRLNSGAPLLNTHASRDLGNVIGVVERAWLARGEGRATVRFSEREDVAPIVADVQAGILRNISVGYSVRKYEVTEGDTPIYRAVDWQPMELSIVPIPADPAAQIRSQGNAMQENAIDTRPDPVAVERQRAADILSLGRRHNVDVAPLIANGVSIDAARAQILETLATRDAEGTRSRLPYADQWEGPDAGVAAATELMAQGLAARSGRVQCTDPRALSYRSASLADMAREICELRGVRTTNLSRAQVIDAVFSRAMTTSDFAGILANSLNKTLAAAYSAPTGLLQVARKVTNRDFRPRVRASLSEAPTLKKVNERGEFTLGTVLDGKETYSLATYGRIFAVTRQVLVNDDLGALDDMTTAFARSAAELQHQTVVDVGAANAALSDGVAVFHANHGNLTGTGTAISVTSLGVGRKMMRLQTGPGGTPIAVAPRYLCVPAALETLAEQTVALLTPAAVADVNPFSGKLQVVVDPRLDAKSATAWYLVSDQASADFLEACFLEGQEGPYIETRQGFETDGLEVKARLDFAAGIVDHRGAYKNVGA